MSFVSVKSPFRDERSGRPAAARPGLRVELLEDRLTPAASLVDVNSSFLAASNGTAQILALTPNGRYAIFSSTGSDVIPQENTTPGVANLYWVDFLTGRRELVTAAPSANSAGTAYSYSAQGATSFSRAFPDVPSGEMFGEAVISDDGRYVAFTSKVNAGSLDANYATSSQLFGVGNSTTRDRGDTTYDVFQWDSRSGSISLASRTYNNGATGASEAFGNVTDAIHPAINGDGSKITFISKRNAAAVYPAVAAGKVGSVHDNGDTSADLFMADMDQVAAGAAQTVGCISIVANPFSIQDVGFPSFFWKEAYGTFGFLSQFQPSTSNFVITSSTTTANGVTTTTITDIAGNPALVGYSPVGTQVDPLGRYLSSDGSAAVFLSDISPAWVQGVVFTTASNLPLTNKRLDAYLFSVTTVNLNPPVIASPTRLQAVDTSTNPVSNVGSTLAVQGGSADNAILARDSDSEVLFTAAVGNTTTGSLVTGYSGATGSTADAMNLYLRNVPAGAFVGDDPILVNAIPGSPTTPGAQVAAVSGELAATLEINYSQVVTSGSSPPIDPRSYNITPDARYVVFTSPSSNQLAPGKGVPSDKNATAGAYDVYRRDTTANPSSTSSLVGVSVASTGTTLANGASYNPSISPDGRYVAFESLASNIVTAGVDTNKAADVYVRDFQASKVSKGNFVAGTALASGSPDGTAAGDSGPSTYSFNGTTTISTFAGGPPSLGSYRPLVGTARVAFTSTAGNLTPSLSVVTGTPHGYENALPLAAAGGGGGSTDTGAVGGGQGQAALVNFTGSGTLKFGATFTPFPGFAGEVRVASADVDGDGTPDLIVGTGPGIASHLVVINGATGTRTLTRTDATTGAQTSYTIDFNPFESSFTGGITVAAADMNGDGFADIVIGADNGGGSRIIVISGKDGKTRLGDFFAYEADFRGGVRVAAGDVNGDGTPDIITGAGFGGGPRVTVFNGATLPQPTRLADYFAFEPTLRNGVYVGAGDINGDGAAEVVVGGGPGGGPRVTAFDGKSLIGGTSGPVQVVNLFVFDPTDRNGVRVAVHDIDGNGTGDLLVGEGTGDQSRVRTYEVVNASAGQTPTLIDDELLFGNFASLNGAWVG